jgi:hexulose-6-phosphate isomerase
MVNGKIQAFPWEHWRSEYPVAHELGIELMEWTLDHEDLYKNPLMTISGQEEILGLEKKYNLKIASLTGDNFMQQPFFKLSTEADLLKDFENIVKACGKLGIEYIVFPLVDNSSIKTNLEEERLIKGLLDRIDLLRSNKVKVAFESDFIPLDLKKFIAKFPKDIFGINYDIGNSASLGFDPKSEFEAYGERIINVHVKDRLLGGTTVPLGTGNANFDLVFNHLKDIGYRGNFILQTARSQTGEHKEFVDRFTKFVLQKLELWT